jgi:predicted SAM-dependent methyltransferase
MGVILNLGCGDKPIEGRVNVDIVDLPGVDHLWDLDDYPWPWQPGSVSEIHCLHIFEHVNDPLGFMQQCWRVLEPDGWLHIEVPHWQSRNAFTDPTHKRFCTEDTFRYWVPGTWLWNSMGVAYHRNCPFREQRIGVQLGDLIVDLRKIV